MAAMLALFELQPHGFTFFDVGSNVGLYTLICGKYFPHSQIVAFEPTPETARIARKLVRVNHVDAVVEELAFAAEDGTGSLFLSAVSDASNSLVEGFKQQTGTVEVRLSTLDSYVSSTGRCPSVMKVDVESFEAQVIAGGKQTLAGARPTLIVEVLNRRGHDHGIELMDAMDGLGYHYYPCTTYSDWTPADTITGDTGRDRDWLLSPNPLPSDFRDRVEAWEARFSAPTTEPNAGSRLIEARSRLTEVGQQLRRQLRIR